MTYKARKFLSVLGVAVLSLGIFAGCAKTDKKNSEDNIVNIYSARHYEVDKQLHKDFEKETGIKVNVIEGKAPELLERMKREGADTQADLFISADIANLYQAVDGEVTQPIKSEVVNKNIPENLRGKDNSWVGLTTRARVIVYDKEKVDPKDLSTYEDLTSDKWKNSILVRSSSSSYNQSLLASFIELNGEDNAKKWAEGIVKNMARSPEGNDRDQVKAVAAGQGKIAIVNSYYIGKLLNSKDPEEVKAAEKVGVFFPKPTHVNVSGVVMSKHSKNSENAIKFVEFMTEKKAQEAMARENSEYPANKSVEPSDLLKSWGEFEAQNIDITQIGKFNKKASEIFDQVGWK
ncbi:MAG: Fe(3+) ABC transporter substrate-binding protein [Clostridium sp.]|uniref:Fe(3+) ABC transporter substrate-binding protein n=1 Tax=Clostridium sp. TaxID=1506 RepID=UPI002FC8E85A